jgi:hypothetical protein
VGLAAVPLGRSAGAYDRHRPETTTLYAVVSDNDRCLVEIGDLKHQPVVRPEPLRNA